MIWLSSPIPAGAWSSPGHMIVACWAFNELTPGQQDRLVAMLQDNPDYPSWKDDYDNGKGDVPLPLYTVMRASTWPDEIKHRGGPYDFPNWHFVDYPLLAPDFAMQPSPLPNDDILFALKQCDSILTNGASTGEEKAVYLSYLIHLLGDIHQPLHCATWIDVDHPAPKGDQGGNLVYLRPSTKGVKLHSFVDGQFGSSTQPDAREQKNQYTLLKASHPRSDYASLIQTDATPESWSLESRALALNKVYLSGTLILTSKAGTSQNPPHGYVHNVKGLAEDQVALAGYRLADLLKKYLP